VCFKKPKGYFEPSKEGVIRLIGVVTLLFSALTFSACEPVTSDTQRKGLFLTFKQLIVDQNDHSHVRSMGDVNGNGKNDIAAFNKGSLLVLYQYPNWKKVILRDFMEFPDYNYYRADDLKLADVDGDGDLDIVGICWDAYSLLHLWRNDAKL
jgi:hypothetical protein